MRSVILIVTLFALCACSHPVTASGGPPHPPSGIPSTACIGNAPVDPEIATVPHVRASWFNPSASERLYVLEAGPRSPNRPTLVLIHGVGAVGTADFYPVLAGISHDRHVLAVDLPGFGRSNPNDNDFGPERLEQVVETVARACATPTVDVLGHSSGGALALLYASNRADKVRKLIVVDAAGILRPEVLLRGQLHQQLTDMREATPRLEKAVERMGDALINAMHAVTPSATALGKSGLLGSGPPILAATSLLDYNFGRAILGVRAPTLLLWGEEDHVMPPRIAHLLDDRIERSELVYIPGSGHVPMKDQPALFASLVAGYLDTSLSAVREKLGEPLRGRNVSTRIQLCRDQDDLELEGDFDIIDLKNCRRFWMHDVRARSIRIHNSQGVLEGAQVREGTFVSDATLAITGGRFFGPVALEVTDSRLDVAGATFVGDTLALRIEGKSELVFSVTAVASPRTSRILHQELSIEDRFQL